MTMLIMGTGVVYSPSLVLLDTQILYLPGDREDKESSESKLSTVCFPLPDMVYYKPQNKMFYFCKTFCSKITLVNTIQNVILNPI